MLEVDFKKKETVTYKTESSIEAIMKDKAIPPDQKESLRNELENPMKSSLIFTERKQNFEMGYIIASEEKYISTIIELIIQKKISKEPMVINLEPNSNQAKYN